MLAALRASVRARACSSGPPGEVAVVLLPARWRSARPSLAPARPARGGPASRRYFPAGSPRTRSTCCRRGARAAGVASWVAEARCSRPSTVRAPGHGGQQPGPAAALVGIDLPCVRSLGLAVRGRGHLALGPGPPPARRHRAPAARGRTPRVPARRPDAMLLGTTCSTCSSARRAPGPPRSWPRAPRRRSPRAAGERPSGAPAGRGARLARRAGFAAASKRDAYRPSVFAMMFFWISDVPP